MLTEINSIISIDQELCTGCRRCAEICPVNAIEGSEGKPQTVNTALCIMCGQCIQICNAYASIFDEEITPVEQKLQTRGLLPTVKEPFFAAFSRGDNKIVKKVLTDAKTFKIVQCAPAVRVALAEEFGMPLGTLVPGKLAAALKLLGFDKVYDTNFAADVTIMEEVNELINRITKVEHLPMFTSCCPAWVKFLEQQYPELIPHLSSCKSPQQMAGVLFKTYGAKINNVDPANIFSVAVMPCTCKKYEAERSEMASSGFQDVDVVITTRELAQLIKDAGIDFNALQEVEFDQPLGRYSGAGSIFGTTGGVMEAALRTAYELITKESMDNVKLKFVRGGEGVRKATVKAGELELKVVVVSGLKNVIPLLEEVKAGKADFHFMEVMTCPAGCISGGGQPKLLLPEDREIAYHNRAHSIYTHDENQIHRKSHENPDIKKLYADFLGEPLGHEAHQLLHTSYKARR